MQRKVPLVEGECYHVFNKSIAGFRIFNNQEDYERMMITIKYYQCSDLPCGLGNFLRLNQVHKMGLDYSLYAIRLKNQKLVQIIAYCIMPTHIHFVLKQQIPNGISNFMRLILNSYANYFNAKYNRLGHLWVGKFKNVLVESDEQLLHLTRYVHLNPTSGGLVKNPLQWTYSSYRQFIVQNKKEDLCCWEPSLLIDPKQYLSFVEGYIDEQKEREWIKKLIVD